MKTAPSPGSRRVKPVVPRRRAQEPPPARDRPVYIVGIGASAGGLEALEILLQGVPAESGMASSSSSTSTRPTRAMHARAPAARDAACRSSRCATAAGQARPRLRDPAQQGHVAPARRPAPVRADGRPAACACRSTSSSARSPTTARSGASASSCPGMGADGTLGLAPSRRRPGSSSSRSRPRRSSTGCPRSAIDAGLADVVAPAPRAPARILSLLAARLSLARRARDRRRTATRSALEKIAHPPSRHGRGTTSPLYKKSTVLRRIERRMGIHQIDRIATYVRFLQENPQEVELLFRELLIGVTSFFRDPAAWDQLRGRGRCRRCSRPAAAGRRCGPGAPGCSTGEEAYSLAIVFQRDARAAPSHRAATTLQVFATDLDPDAIARARQGLYPAGSPPTSPPSA